ncbi:chromosome segregation protein SMC [Psychrosphaera haliotis]|uniref:chromosome segregation protein SMC n=1 Tax=Psychrosphaera haliotis TaxID=555083 RepID=UPI0031D203EE
MRLKHIKLVGFKSFVDATTVPFPQQMTAIVGPNGCGKSNVIDAVRWVLGESSAKNLRGDAMTDVIFNGSTNRKPVSQASVELVFDNTEGKLQGQLADRSEISIKRSVTKEAISTYFLNGTKCRRRDITDIFLGTGLGPRSYAIIEQGMISRLIESKPQELRVFLEEAAGISKYKERRKETETRIRHTRENLERLADVREELGTQLDKLKKQAATARRFKELKKQERQYKAELAALKWHKYNEQFNFHTQQQRLKETELEAFVAQQRGGELGLLTKKEQLQELTDQIQKSQQLVFQAGNTITKLEQQIVFEQQNKSRYQEQLNQIETSLTESQQHLVVEQTSFDEISEQLLSFEPEQELLHEKLAQAEQNLFDLEQQYERYQQGVNTGVQALAKAQQAIKIIDTRLHHQQLELSKNNQKLSGLKIELHDLSSHDLDSQVLEQENQLDELKSSINLLSEQYAEAALKDDQHQQSRQEAENNLQQTIRRQEHLQIKLEQLEQWRRELSSNESGSNNKELPTKGLLLAQLKVATQWQNAVEQLLSHQGEVMLIDSLPSHELAKSGQYVSDSKNVAVQPGSVMSVIRDGQAPLWFNRVAIATSLEQANQLLNNKTWAAVILPSGQLIGENWTGLGGPLGKGDSSALKRLAEIETIKNSLADIELQVFDKQNILEHTLTETKDSQAHYQAVKAKLELEKQALQKLELESKFAQQQATQTKQQQSKLQSQIVETELQIEESNLSIEVLLEEQLMAQEQEIEVQTAAESTESQKTELQNQVANAKMALESVKQDSHQASLKLQSLQDTKTNLQQNIQRANQQITQLKQRQKDIANTSQNEADNDLLNEQLEQALVQKLEAEEKLQALHGLAAQVDEEIKELESGQSGVIAKLDKMRDAISDIKMDAEGARIRAQNMLESLKDQEQALKPLLENMPEEAEESLWSDNLEKASNSIQRLGAINLAAIDEYDVQAERKGYLDEQYTDLNNALETLESAIRKIDRESRSKFKETFDKVNEGLQTLFPKVFGGGAAYLELTGEDLLETGVSIMARPPGKKNSTIHLLSGGEKALTALSLVFSIFKLNPAPFCMLDEVDAPLDDANVGRFCKLVNEMSESVQFIYISHNKVAMEMATHLTGVTMQEPGVSRLVAVDIQQAVEMADAV